MSKHRSSVAAGLPVHAKQIKGYCSEVWLPSGRILHYIYKKVLLRERKRHTARCVAVASACYSGGGVLQVPPLLPGPGMGYPAPHPDLGWGIPPTWTWDGVPPLPRPEMGYPPLARPEMGYPPPRCGLTN